MGLSNIKPLIGSLKSPLRRTDAQGHDDQSRVRAWYKSAEWARLRVRVFRRDDYICQECGNVCRPGDRTHGPIADHKIPHRGDRALFFDETNVQTLGKSPCHDKLKQRAERAARTHPPGG